MSDHIEALERLARMRADGTLTDAEFQTEKARILGGSLQASPRTKTLAEGWEETTEMRRSLWSNLKWQMVAFAILVPAFGYFAWTHLQKMTPQEAAQVVADGLPACGSQEVKDTLRNAIETGPAANLVNIKVLEIAHIENRGTGGTPMKRYCAADVTTNGGAEHIGYTIRYSNEASGEFIVEIGEDTGPPPATELDASQTGENLSGALPLDDAWLVGNWAFADICGTDNMISFHPDGTYLIPGVEEGLYSTEGGSVRFYQSWTTPSMGEDDAGFTPEAKADEVLPVQPVSKNSMILNGQRAMRC